MSENVKKCIPILNAYCNASPKERKKIMTAFENCIIKAAREIALNTLKGNLPLTTSEKNQLKRYKSGLIKLASQTTSKVTKKKVLNQSGRGIFSLLLPLVASAVGSYVSR